MCIIYIYRKVWENIRNLIQKIENDMDLKGKMDQKEDNDMGLGSIVLIAAHQVVVQVAVHQVVHRAAVRVAAVLLVVLAAHLAVHLVAALIVAVHLGVVLVTVLVANVTHIKTNLQNLWTKT